MSSRKLSKRSRAKRSGSRRLPKKMSTQQIKKIAKTIGINMRKSLQKSHPLTKALRKSIKKAGISTKMANSLTKKAMKDWTATIKANKGVRNFFAKSIASQRLKLSH